MAKKITLESKIEETEEKPKTETAEKIEITLVDVLTSMISAYGENADKDDIPKFHKKFEEYLIQTFDKSKLSKDYELVILYDDTTMLKSDADKIYNAVTKFEKKKSVLMILLSNGG